MHTTTAAAVLLLAAGLAAQGTAVYPADYQNVAEGPFNSPNLPLANGTGRALCVYEQWDLPLQPGATITRLSFRQDATLTAMDTGRSLQLEVRMGYTQNTHATLSTNFDANYAAAPVTVFGPALLALPNLRDANNPLADGKVHIDLTTPFVYQPGAGDNLVVEYRIFGNSGGGTAWNYRLDRADYYSPLATGTPGCRHSGGRTPTLTLSPVRTGSSFTASIASGPGNSLALLLIAPGQQLAAPFALDTIVPGIDPTCQGQLPLLGTAALTAFTSGSGTATVSFTIPNQRVYNDVFLACQAAFFDLFAPGGVAVSNGEQLQIGIQPQSSVLWGAGPPATVTTGSINQRYCPVAFFTWQ